MRTIVVVALYCLMYCNVGKIVPSSSIHIQHHNTARGKMGLEDLRLKGPVGVGEGPQEERAGKRQLKLCLRGSTLGLGKKTQQHKYI